MGKIILIVMAGVATSFGIMTRSNNVNFLAAVDQMVEQRDKYSISNAASSGAYAALSQLYLDKTWRDGYTNLVLSGDTVNVTVTTTGTNTVQILSTASNGSESQVSDVTLFDSKFNDFAVWADSMVDRVTTKDSSTGAVNSDRLKQYAPFMPDIDYQALYDMADNQNNLEVNNEYWEPDNNYPNSSFFASGQTPNVTYVGNNLRVKENRTVWGIFVVEGNVILRNNATVEGIIITPNSSTGVVSSFAVPGNTQVKGGIVTYGSVDGDLVGSTYTITVTHYPGRMQTLVNNFVPKNPPLHVLKWE